MQVSFRYDQTSARLQVDGLPDFSRGQHSGTLGIVSSWTLSFVGLTQLEGKKEHLQALLRVVLPYARHTLSGIDKTFGDALSPVSISSFKDREGHLMKLKSSQKDVEPLEILLDDAELADLVRCLDEMRLDPRVQIKWDVPNDRPLSKRETATKWGYTSRFGQPFLATLAFLAFASILILLPIPQNDYRTTPVLSDTKELENQ